MWIMVLLAIIFTVAIVGICVYAYYYNNVWHPVNHEQANTVTWVNAEGQTRSMRMVDLFLYSSAAYDKKHCLICDSRDEVTYDRKYSSRDCCYYYEYACPACEAAFKKALGVEVKGGERVFPGYDIDDINRPYNTWRQYAYILRQMDDGVLSETDGREQIAKLLDKQSKTAEAARQAPARVAAQAAAQARSAQRAAAEEHLRRIAEKGRKL